MAGNWKSWKLRNIHLKNDEIPEKREKWDMHTVGPGIWRENWKLRKMINTHFRTLNMARKTEKGGNLEMSTVGHGIWQENWKSLENEKHQLDDLKNDEITERREKWECTL